jgi:flavin-dependent dehydrogenase
MLSACTGRHSIAPLDLGGFGISRYAFDQFLYEKARLAGAEFLLKTQVQDINFANDHFQVFLPQSEQLTAKIVIGAYGKRARLDKQLQRRFMRQPSPYIAVKYHVKTDFPDDYIALHNFKGGYCGISRVENGIYNLCYLGNRGALRHYGNIKAMEEAVLCQNPFLREIFNHATFLFDKPEVINEVSFAPKKTVENHILMSGDTAGLITPLCGNGMAMAIHSAKLLSELIIQYYHPVHFVRETLEKVYARQWQQLFAVRLWVGRHAQKLFGSSYTSEIGVQLFKYFPPVTRQIMRYTHGKPF